MDGLVVHASLAGGVGLFAFTIGNVVLFRNDYLSLCDPDSMAGNVS